MTALEMLQLATSSGVLAGGIGLLKWGLVMERRVARLEVQDESDRENRRVRSVEDRRHRV